MNFDSIDDWLDAQPTQIREVSKRLRRSIANSAPRLSESMKWGNACWSDDRLPLVFLHVEDDHVQLGFFAGAMLDDPEKLLHGNAKYVRHIRIETEADLDEPEIERMIVRAIEAPPYR